MSTSVTIKPAKKPRRRSSRRNQYGLTEAQEAFVRVLIADPFCPTTTAAVKAGIKPAEAPSRSYRWLQSPAVQAELQRRKEVAQHAEPAAEIDVIRRISDLAGVDVTELFAIDGQTLTLQQFHALTAMQRQIVQGVEIVPTKFGTRLKVQTIDKLKALELLGRYHGAFVDRTEISGSITLVPSLPEPAPPPPLPPALADE